MDHLQAEIFSLREDEVDDRREDNDENAEHEEYSTERKITFQKWEHFHRNYKEYAGDCSCQALES